VVRKVVGYKKIKFYTSENLGYGDVTLPEKDMHTTSYWFTIPRNVLMSLPQTQAEIIDGLSGLAYCLHHLAAMKLMADVRDIDRCIGDKSGEWFIRSGKNGRMITEPPDGLPGESGMPGAAFDPTLFIFDAYPGGIGFSDLLFEQHDGLLTAAYNLIKACPCNHGCPSCVGPTLEVGPMAKETSLAILAIIGYGHH
jgi:DEAD/DEAH box helicase domain-containing protein